MSRNPKLSDLQLILLSTAAQREEGSLFPAAESIRAQADRLRKAIPTLLRRGLAEEVPTSARTLAWREQEDRLIGLAITAAGRTIIAADESDTGGAQQAASEQQNKDKPAPAPRAGGKVELVLGLLRRSEGATIADLTGATGWLPHTTRAALTGLRKKGHAIEKSKRDDVTCYRVAEAG